MVKLVPLHGGLVSQKEGEEALSCIQFSPPSRRVSFARYKISYFGPQHLLDTDSLGSSYEMLHGNK